MTLTLTFDLGRLRFRQVLPYGHLLLDEIFDFVKYVGQLSLLLDEIFDFVKYVGQLSLSVCLSVSALQPTILFAISR